MRAVFAVALATAFSRDRRHRWRQVSVLVAAFMATVACGFVITLPTASRDAYELGSARGPIFASQPAPGSEEVPDDAVAILLFRATIVDGEQVPTVWVEPLPGHEDDPSAVPIGLSELPAPGAAVLSPGLAHEGYVAEDFGWASSSSGTNADGSIGYPGIMTASEPLIFVRPPEGRTLATSSVEQYVQGFGVPPSQDFVAFAMDPEFLTSKQLAIGGAAFVILPALVLVISAARARSALREDRMRFLVNLGIAEWRARTLIALETGALAAVGSLGAAIPWWIASGSITKIPLADVAVRPGDLHSPWWVLFITVLLIVLLASCVGAIGNVNPPWRGRQRRKVSLVATFAMLGSAVLLSLAALRRLPFTDPMAPNVTILLIGVFGILVFTPLAMPQLIAWVGRLLQRLSSPTMWATGRRMVAEPRHLSRIASVLSILIILVSTGMALGLGSVRAEPQQGAEGDAHGASVSWVGAKAGDVDDVTDVLGSEGNGLLVLPIVDPGEEKEGQGAVPPQLLVRDCAAALQFIGAGAGSDVTCDGDAAEALLEGVLRADIVTEENREGRVATNAVTVFSNGTLSIERLQEDLGWLPGLNVSHDSRTASAPLPIHRWIGAGLVAVLVLAGTAAIREIGDRSVDDAERDAQYARIGVSGEATRRLAWASLLVPMILSVVLATALSTVIVYAGQSIELMRQEPFKLLIICLSTFAITVVSIAVSLPARRAMIR